MEENKNLTVNNRDNKIILTSERFYNKCSQNPL